MWFFNFRKKNKPYSSTYKFPADIQDFFNALRDCHLGNHAEYFNELKKLAGLYPEEPVFWLFAGDILRDKNPEKALELHRDVLFRTGTSGVFRSMVLEHVAYDYIVLKQNQKAVSVLKEASKCSDYPAASLLLSEVYESDGNFDAGMDEMKKYLSVSGSKSDVPLQRYSARAVNHFFKSLETDKESVLKWLGIYSKKCGDSNQLLAADYMVFLIESNAKKAVNCLKKLIEAGDGWEIFARSMLLNFHNGSEINYSAEGVFKEIFHVLMNKNLKYEAKNADEAGNTQIEHKLLIRNALPEGSVSLEAVVPDKSLFVCGECGKRIDGLMPVCPTCQKITTRKFFK